MHLTKSIAIVLLCCFSFQLSAKAVWLGYFQLNKIEFINNFCINKSKPKSACEAKCYLKKQAEQEKQTERNLPGFIKEKESTETICVNSHFETIKLNSLAVIYPPLLSFYSHSNPYAPFHPPTVA